MSRPPRKLARTAAAGARRAEALSGLPARFAIPALVAGIALQVAVLGMYWDIAWHVDNGRDDGLLTAPHLLIVLGLQGIVAAALLHGRMPGPRARGEIRLPGLSLSPGGVQMLACGAIALIAFPLDDVWHRLFGEDVTLWGPTHLFMIGGAGMSTLGMWMLIRHAWELGEPRRRMRGVQARIAGGLLIGLSTFQAEFDFGVPQFQLLYQPVLIAFAAGLGLVCARLLLGPLGALKALGMYYLVRGGLALIVGPVLGFTTPHFPLYLAEALIVEGAAVLWLRRGDARFAALAGAGIGTLGLAAEWAWSHAWMPHPWTASMLPQALVLSLAAAIGGAVLGARIAQALTLPAAGTAAAPARARIPGRAVAVAGLAALVALAVPLPRTGADGTRASIVPTPTGDGRVALAVALDPPDAAAAAEWFEVISWQGRERRRLTELREVAPGRYAAASTIPVGGGWKSMVRLARGGHLTAMPISLPPAPEAGRAGVAPVARSGLLQSDTFLLQREARGGPGWLTTLAYSLLAGIVALWLAVTAWSLRLAEPPRRPAARPAPGPRGQLATP